MGQLGKLLRPRSLSTTTPAESFSSDADDSLDSVMTTISKTSDLVGNEAKEVLEEINRLVLFRNRRTKIRRTVFAAFAIIFVILTFIGATVYNQHLIYQGYINANNAFEEKRWDDVHEEIDKIKLMRSLRRMALPLFFGAGPYDRIFQLFGIADWNKTDFQCDMLDREGYYRAGVAAYINKNWSKAIDEFRVMEKADKAFLSKYPVYGVNKPESIEKNKRYRQQYLAQKREYQERRELKEYFVDITPLFSDSLYYAGLNSYKKRDWQKALTYLRELPNDEKYEKVKVECTRNLSLDRQYKAGLEAYKKGDWENALACFSKLPNNRKDNKLIEECKRNVLKKPNGVWKGNWSNPKGYKYSFDMKVNIDDSNKATASIDWTFKKSPRSRDRSKIGLKATEYLRGAYDPKKRTLHMEGYRKSDPKGIISLDEYKLFLSKDGLTLSGKTRTHCRDWRGKFRAKRRM